MSVNVDTKDFLARYNDNKSQLLSTHLMSVANLSSTFCDCTSLLKLAGITHDFGKATVGFQNYLIDDNGVRGSVVHALQGAFYIDDIVCKQDDIYCVFVREILSMIVAAHHNHLADGISPDGETLFNQKFFKKNGEEYHYSEAKQRIVKILPDFENLVQDLMNAAQAEIKKTLSSIQEKYKPQTSEYKMKSAKFALGLFVKYIYSCLIDADRLDAYLFETNEVYKPPETNWDALINIFEQNIQKLGGRSTIAEIRRSVSNQCKEAAAKETGIYRLSVPTGGGKTLSSLRFALHHCKKRNKKRVIYVIPYLSIIEQTASEIRKILELTEKDGTLLEAHSNIVMPDDKDERGLRMLAASRWDKPIIVTTMVQFLETVMSSRAGELRKFHNMSDSVIIFDEIQSLPIRAIHLFNETVSYLAKICNTTVLLCTATQPLLDKTERKNLLLESSPDLISCGELFRDLKRTRIVACTEKNIDEFAGFISDEADKSGNCLAIVNTKKSARQIFDRLKNKNGFEIYHLSTAMCPAHRADILIKLKSALTAGRKIICIATQLIEAGVDISFSCVVRAAAGLDSVTQAAGRCNRNGESTVSKEVYVIPIRDENLDTLADIKSGKEITERLIHENKDSDLSDPAIMEQFYKYYFLDRKNLMDYPTGDGKTVYDFLSINKSGKSNYKNRTGKEFNAEKACLIPHAFYTADMNFAAIDKKTEPVVVHYSLDANNGKDAVEELINN